ncbi:MAG: hypothetical protein KTR31_24210 [Myxococcales bacterium]|nr:hypothetical protein [Myxococcales bacterium]
MRWTIGSVVLFAVAGCTKRSEEVVVRDTARILDLATHGALMEMRPNGELVFDASSPQVADLTEGTTLLMEASDVVPMGLIRKVVSAEESGGLVTLQTEPGMLWSVIQNGGFEEEFTLEAADLALMDPMRGIDMDLGFVIADADGDLTTTGDQVRVDGSVIFNAGWNVGWKIFDSGGLFDDLNPFDAFDLEFEASVGIEEDVEVEFVAAPLNDLDVQTRAYEHYFEPKTFWVGPVPVVITPRVTVDVGVRGRVQGATHHFGAHQWFVAKLGARCDTDGCSTIKRLDDGFDTSAGAATPSVQGYSSSVDGYAEVSMDLLVYGVAGPYGTLQPYVGMDARVPSRPAWELEGGIRATAGLEVSPLGLDWDAELFDESWALAEAGNHPPEIRVSRPLPDTSFLVNVPVEFSASALDMEEGFACCTPTFRTDVDGDLGSPDVFGTVEHTFATPGPRVVTASVTDADGETTSVAVPFEITNVPPDVSIAAPSNEETRYRGVPFLVHAAVVDGSEPSGTVPCADATFSGGAVGDLLPASMCQADANGLTGARFENLGVYDLTLTAVDSYGAVDAETVSLTIVEPMGDLRPDVTILSPKHGAQILAGQNSVLVEAHVFDGDDDEVSYNWSTSWGGADCTPWDNVCTNNANITFGTLQGANAFDPNGAEPPGVTQTYDWAIFSTLPGPSCGETYYARINYSFSGATNGRAGWYWITVSQPPC